MNNTLDLLKALSDRNRLRVVAALTETPELCACQIVELLDVTGATASRHMSLLLNAGIIDSRKEGRWVYYQLADSLDALFYEWLKNEFNASDDVAADRQKLTTIIASTPENLCRKQRGANCCPTEKETV